MQVLQLGQPRRSSLGMTTLSLTSVRDDGHFSPRKIQMRKKRKL